MTAETAGADFNRFAGLKVPTKRAAYSDRTAWLMAIMAELAYVPFDQDGPNELLSLALDLARLGVKHGLVDLDDRSMVSDLVRAEIDSLLQGALDKIGSDEDAGNKLLQGLLAQGGFTLKGVLFDERTNTQGFVATKRAANLESGMAVVVFRGTQQKMDWWTNLNARTEDVPSRKAGSDVVVGRLHAGFNRAYLSVEHQIHELLKDDEDLPLYITGHSLGGALATIATWYLSGEKLSACYTFGAPRVGDSKLRDRYRTPIYRIVNGADPVPFVPPSEMTVTLIRNAIRAVSIVLPLGGYLERISGLLVNVQGYRHYGDSRYLTICKPTRDEKYPKLSVEPAISPLGRLARHLMRWREGAWSRGARLDKYHDMAVYRRKLRYWAEKRQDNVI